MPVPNNLVPKDDFFAFWNLKYTGYDEEFYREHLGKPLNAELIPRWFEWKNRMPLSPSKTRSIAKYSLPGEHLPADAGEPDVRAFLNRSGGAIWRIFWLHIQHPEMFPIYDQHTHRAMAFLLGWPQLSIPKYNPRKVSSYLESYLTLFRQFAPLPQRQVDRALFAFGQYLVANEREMRRLRPVPVIPMAKASAVP